MANVVDGGSGTWDNAGTNWTNAAGGISNSPWVPGTALFGGVAGGTVTLGDNISFSGLQFTTDGYVIAGAGGFKLSPVGTAGVMSPPAGGDHQRRDHRQRRPAKTGPARSFCPEQTTTREEPPSPRGRSASAATPALGTARLTVATGNIFAAGANHTVSNGITINGTLTVIDDPNSAHNPDLGAG